MANTSIRNASFRLSARRFQLLAAVMLAGSFGLTTAWGQVFTMTREQLIKYTAQNPYERYPDGRPKVPDAVLQKLNDLSSEEIGLSRSGFPNQFVDSLQPLHPGKKLIGRAVTLQLMPLRPDIADVDAAEWKAAGNARPRNHQNTIDLIQAGDVYVVDVFGSVASGGVIGDNLAFYIMTNGAGFVIDGAIRDLEGIAAFDLAGYFKGATPPAIHNVMVTGVNIPVRIGNTTVMPGDVVFGDREGVSFIPPHLVQGIIDAAQTTRIHDEWNRQKFSEKKYKSTEIYSRPRDPALLKEYEDFLKQKLGSAAPAPAPARKQ
jgi:regulator of RNase E activity RraA